MSARPLIPGRAYRVHAQGRSIDVLASGPVDALLRVLDILSGRG